MARELYPVACLRWWGRRNQVGRHLSRVVSGRYSFVTGMSPAVKEHDASFWRRWILPKCCPHSVSTALISRASSVAPSSCSDLAQEFFSAASSTDWACELDDFQLSEEVGPTWECCQSGLATQGLGIDRPGLTGSTLADFASVFGVVGCRSVPLLSEGRRWGHSHCTGGRRRVRRTFSRRAWPWLR